MSARYEWIAGPHLVTAHEHTEFHHGKGVLEHKGRKIRLIVGQVRDRELNILLNWAMESPQNPTNVRLAISALECAWPTAADWTAKLRKNLGEIPKAWKPPAPDSEFQCGLVI